MVFAFFPLFTPIRMSTRFPRPAGGPPDVDAIVPATAGFFTFVCVPPFYRAIPCLVGGGFSSVSTSFYTARLSASFTRLFRVYGVRCTWLCYGVGVRFVREFIAVSGGRLSFLLGVAEGEEL